LLKTIFPYVKLFSLEIQVIDKKILNYKNAGCKEGQIKQYSASGKAMQNDLVLAQSTMFSYQSGNGL